VDVEKTVLFVDKTRGHAIRPELGVACPASNVEKKGESACRPEKFATNQEVADRQSGRFATK
jgi:hypothetical protein